MSSQLVATSPRSACSCRAARTIAARVLAAVSARAPMEYCRGDMSTQFHERSWLVNILRQTLFPNRCMLARAAYETADLTASGAVPRLEAAIFCPEARSAQQPFRGAECPILVEPATDSAIG